MKKLSLSFDDVLIKPADFSEILSRADVDTTTTLCNKKFSLGIVSSNMDSVYSPKLAYETIKAGGASCVHRFCTIDENIKLFKSGAYYKEPYYAYNPWVSIGVGAMEYERASALMNEGASVIVLDLANGACMSAVEQYKRIKERFKYVSIVVGNFATSGQINSFISHCGSVPDLFKCSIGSGSACITRNVTGIGVPSFTCLMDCVSTGHNVIFDGGIKNPGDFCKALALGAKGVMMGRVFASCEESPGRIIACDEDGGNAIKRYRGSASKSSYESQDKVANHRTPEGEEYTIPVTGTVAQLMQQYSAGLRSSMTYLNATNLNNYRKNAQFIRVSNNSFIESGAHGKL